MFYDGDLPPSYSCHLIVVLVRARLHVGAGLFIYSQIVLNPCQLSCRIWDGAFVVCPVNNKWNITVVWNMTRGIVRSFFFFFAKVLVELATCVVGVRWKLLNLYKITRPRISLTEFFSRYLEDFISDYLVSYLSVFVNMHFISRLFLYCVAVNPLIPPPLPNAATCSYELLWFPSWLWR